MAVEGNLTRSEKPDWKERFDKNPEFSEEISATAAFRGTLAADKGFLKIDCVVVEAVFDFNLALADKPTVNLGLALLLLLAETGGNKVFLEAAVVLREVIAVAFAEFVEAGLILLVVAALAFLPTAIDGLL